MTPEDGEALAEVQRRSYDRTRNPSWPPEDALDAEGLEDLLRRRRYCVLATSGPDGRAQARPVAFVVADAAFWIATVSGARLRNLQATGWASLVVMEGEADEGEEGERHRALTGDGPVRLFEGDAFAPAFARLEEDWLARHGHGPDWAAALVELRPERLFSHRAGPGR